MDAIEAITTTGAVREFTDEPVPRSVLVELLDAARFAASGGNRQPWRVALVEDRALRRRLGDLMQPVWDEYVALGRAGAVPFNAVDDPPRVEVTHAANPLIDRIETIPGVIAVAADLRRIVAIDDHLERAGVVAGASIYPFCWNVLLAARARGLGGVLTTMLTRVEPEAGELLGLPEHHALAAVVFVGRPRRQPTRLSRSTVSSFATIDRFDGSPVDDRPA